MVLAIKINDSLGIADSYVCHSAGLNPIGKIEESLKYSLDAIKIYDILLKSDSNKFRQKILKGKGLAHNMIGLIYLGQGNSQESLKNHYIALKIREGINDKRGIAGQTENDVYQFSSVEIDKSKNMMM